jgi:CubicO group peptidase (beta-lactamase class C family)
MIRPLATLAFIAAASVAAAVPVSSQSSREPYPGFDAYVNTALKTFDVPGAAIAIVRNDSVIYARGYGVRDIEKRSPVDERTLFAIGSASKAFTAASLAMLAEEGKLLWGAAMFDRREVLRRVRFLEPSWGFRSQFGYQNLMYMAAGEVVREVSGTSWEDFVARRIFAPLAMSSSSTSITALASQSDVASPHMRVDDTVRVVPWRNIDIVGPAGSINSHVLDMAQWVRLQLGKGRYQGKQIIRADLVEEMHTPHTIIRIDTAQARLNPDTHFSSYGLGWFLQDYRGKKVVHHGGNIDGMSALVAMLPDERFGMVILTNMNGTPLPTALMYRTFDAHLKAPPKDWSAEIHRNMQRQLARAREAAQRRLAERATGTKPSLALERYVGTYADSMYGQVKVTNEGGTLRMAMGALYEGPLEHWHYDTFRANWVQRHRGQSFVTFRLNASARVTGLEIEMGGGAIEFRRVPDATGRTAERAR